MYIDRDNGTTAFTPTDLTDSISCAHLFAEKLKRARGERKWPPRETEDNLVQRKGEEHEAAYLKALKAAAKNVAEIEINDDDWSIPIAQTREAIKDPAVDVVFQAHLTKDNWRGRADFLERNPDTGLFEVMDTKLARKVKPYMVLQLCIYSDALADIQGAMPEHMHIVLGNNTRETLRVNDFIHYYRASVARLEKRAAANGSGESTYPWPVAHCDNCRLNDECIARREADDHLTLVAGITRQQIKKLNTEQIETLHQLANADDDHRPMKLSTEMFNRLRKQADLQTLPEPGEWSLLEPHHERGFALLPEPDAGDLFYDIEGDPLWDGDGSLEYLHGVWFIEDGSERFEPYWSHDREEERASFERLIDYFVARHAEFPAMHIYHYAPYETTALKRLAQTYGTREDEVDELLRAHAFVDLFRVVQQSLQASVRGYSIKDIEKFYMGERKAAVKKGDVSIEEYERWREVRDQSILDSIGEYNEEDCRSTYLLREWLLARRAEALEQFGEKAFDATSTEDDEDPESEPENPSDAWLRKQAIRDKSDELRGKLFARATELREIGDESNAETLELAAELLHYFRREAKPQQWNVFDKSLMSDEELIADNDAIGGLVSVTGQEPLGTTRRSHVYRLNFEPQDFKIRPTDQLLDPDTRRGFGSIREINETEGWLEITRGTGRADEPLPRGIIPGWPIDTAVIEARLNQIAEGLLGENALRIDTARDPVALRMLRRDLPLDGESLQVPEGPARLALLDKLDGSNLMIQGPPGTGKTYNGAEMIVHLLKEGKRVGVTAPGHSAIDNLVRAVEKRAKCEGVEFRGIKKLGRGGEFDSAHGMVDATSSSNGELFDDYALIAGTAWLFSSDAWPGELDYMFIDEAGQMSLAASVAVSAAAKTTVLLGDPSQLPQVTQGVHPGGSGVSAMEHLLGEHATVPPVIGLFLEDTRRLHPDICEFISEAFYESRLQPHPSTSKFGSPAGTGLRYLSVEHEGCRLESEEEAEAIATEVRSLLELGVELDDIIIVAPYNAQVDLLRTRLPQGIRVGTVDKFQGQEALVVFYSLTASSREEVPRGLEFLFSPERFNVAVSRAQALAYLVGSPSIIGVEANSVKEMRLANRVCGFAARAS